MWGAVLVRAQSGRDYARIVTTLNVFGEIEKTNVGGSCAGELACRCTHRASLQRGSPKIRPRDIDGDMFDGLEKREIELEGACRSVWCGGDGPPIVVMHEIPGLHPQVIDFGRRLISEGFSIYMPSLIGKPGKTATAGYSVQSMAKACVRRDFATWATGKNSPITVYLRALARLANEETGLPVGAVGMCLTGGFALAMAVEDCVQAPVLSQPSLPFPISKRHRRDLGIDDATLEVIKRRAEEEDVCVLGLRFSEDRLVPPARFERLRSELGDRFLAVEIDSSPNNAHGIGKMAHSVLATDLVDEPGHPTREALERVIEFFRERLAL